MDSAPSKYVGRGYHAVGPWDPLLLTRRPPCRAQTLACTGSGYSAKAWAQSLDMMQTKQTNGIHPRFVLFSSRVWNDVPSHTPLSRRPSIPPPLLCLLSPYQSHPATPCHRPVAALVKAYEVYDVNNDTVLSHAEVEVLFAEMLPGLGRPLHAHPSPPSGSLPTGEVRRP